jgi:transposase-like protein
MDRVEVITRVERRRKWSEAEKAAVLAETDAPGTNVAAVARKHGIARSVVYNWRSARRAQAIRMFAPLSIGPRRTAARLHPADPATRKPTRLLRLSVPRL